MRVILTLGHFVTPGPLDINFVNGPAGADIYRRDDAMAHEGIIGVPPVHRQNPTHYFALRLGERKCGEPAGYAMQICDSEHQMGGGLSL